jgi:hypothetical protein
MLAVEAVEESEGTQQGVLHEIFGVGMVGVMAHAARHITGISGTTTASKRAARGFGVTSGDAGSTIGAP